MAFKLGCLPGSIPSGLRDLTFYSAGPLPKPPAEVAVPSVGSWGMDGNDTYGDCGVAGINHGFMADAVITDGNKESFPVTQEVVDYYLQYTQDQDSGVVLSDFLSYVRANGFFGHTVEAYAPAAVHDIPTLQYSIDAYGFAYTGINVTQAMMNAVREAPSGWTWTLAEALGQPAGGHCIPLVGYDDNFLYAVTWGQVISISYPAWHSMSTEAWAVITGEFTAKNSDGRGISLAALQADLSRIAN